MGEFASSRPEGFSDRHATLTGRQQALSGSQQALSGSHPGVGLARLLRLNRRARRDQMFETVTHARPGVFVRRGMIVVKPTRHCLWLALVLVAMFVAAVNYQSNPAWFLVFAVFAATAVSALHARRNLAAVELVAVDTVEGFSGEALALPLTLRNRSATDSLAIEVSAPGHDVEVALIERFEAAQVQPVALMLAPRARGPFTITRIRLATIFPLGLFRAWRDFRIIATGLVYPRPGGLRVMDLPPDPEGVQERGTQLGSDDFRGHRRWQLGDSPRRVDWKAVARGRGMLVKEYQGGGGDLVWFEWDRTAGDDEQRLSQLCRWVIEAQRLGILWGLAIPGLELGPDDGPLHRRACLEALARFGHRNDLEAGSRSALRRLFDRMTGRRGERGQHSDQKPKAGR